MCSICSRVAPLASSLGTIRSKKCDGVHVASTLARVQVDSSSRDRVRAKLLARTPRGATRQNHVHWGAALAIVGAAAAAVFLLTFVAWPKPKLSLLRQL